MVVPAWLLGKESWEAGNLVEGLLVVLWRDQAYSSDETRSEGVGCQAVQWKCGVSWAQREGLGSLEGQSGCLAGYLL